MILGIKNLITKLLNYYKFKIIYLILIFLILIFCRKIYSKEINFETELAIKYCDSINKNLFKGLDNEKILKYEYFFNSTKKGYVNDLHKTFLYFEQRVEETCDLKLTSKDKKEFNKLLKKFADNIK